MGARGASEGLPRPLGCRRLDFDSEPRHTSADVEAAAQRGITASAAITILGPNDLDDLGVDLSNAVFKTARLSPGEIARTKGQQLDIEKERQRARNAFVNGTRRGLLKVRLKADRKEDVVDPSAFGDLTESASRNPPAPGTPPVSET